MTRDQHPHPLDERDPRARREPPSAEPVRMHPTEPDDEIPAGASLDDEPPVPLAALRPARGDGARGEDRFAVLAARIEAAAAPELARRGAASDVRVLPLRPRSADVTPVVATGDEVLAFLGRALRPSLIAAAAALLLAAALGRIDDRADGARAVASAGGSVRADPIAGQLVTDGTVARALAVDDQSASWIAQREVPSDDELALAIAYGGVR